MVIGIGDKAIKCYCFLPSQNATLREQYEHYWTLVSQSECRYFYVLAMITLIYDKNITFYTFNENKNIITKI